MTPLDANEAKTRKRASLAEAAELIRNGEVVGFPTETVYGLGAVQ